MTSRLSGDFQKAIKLTLTVGVSNTAGKSVSLARNVVSRDLGGSRPADGETVTGWDGFAWSKENSLINAADSVGHLEQLRFSRGSLAKLGEF